MAKIECEVVYEIEVGMLDDNVAGCVGRVEWRPRGAENCMIYLEGSPRGQPATARTPAAAVQVLFGRWLKVLRERAAADAALELEAGKEGA